MSLNRKQVKIKDKIFLVQSELKLSKSIQLLGFWKTPQGWSKHVVAIDLSTKEYQELEIVN